MSSSEPSGGGAPGSGSISTTNGANNATNNNNTKVSSVSAITTATALSGGESYVSMNYQTRLSSSFICQTVPIVCKSIYENLKGIYMKAPGEPAEWEQIAKEFAVKWQFPNCLGALDGKHINFRPPRVDGAFFHNYKGTNSIILLALVDANCRFIYVDVGCNGRVNDAGVLMNSTLRKIIDEERKLPPNAVIGNNRCVPYVIVADDAFPLQNHIMKPYPYHTNRTDKKVFNMRISRARHVVEHAFGILSNRFRIFQTTMNLKVDTVQYITLASCALHNFLISIDANYANNYTTTSNATNDENASEALYNPRKGEAENIRQQYMAYFNEEGKLDWQFDKL